MHMLIDVNNFSVEKIGTLLLHENLVCMVVPY
jgi:hypothetical protein